jgi:hypothetical protein
MDPKGMKGIRIGQTMKKKERDGKGGGDVDNDEGSRMWVRIERGEEQKGARGRRKGSLTLGALPKRASVGLDPSTKLPTTSPTPPSATAALLLLLCETGLCGREGSGHSMGAARLARRLV